jgi:hypothetical protein
VKIVKRCVRHSKIPEQILMAHKIVSEERRKIQAAMQCR